jgi:cobalt transporter subunit CbtA
MQLALVAGAAAGFVLFLSQWVLVTPLIRRAEAYERIDPVRAASHADESWEPGEGLERVAYTGLGTVLAGVGFGAVLFGVASLIGLDLGGGRGLRLGAAGFFCFTVAPSIGLPPRPPGVAGPELHAAQIWWALTVLLAAFGLWLLTRSGRSKLVRGGGVFALALPFLVGAPAAEASSLVPRELVWRFTATAIGTQALFWLVLGAVGGWMHMRALEKHGANLERPS